MSRTKPFEQDFERKERPESLKMQITNKFEVSIYDKEKRKNTVIEMEEFNKQKMNFIFLERSFFLYAYDNKTETEWRSGEYLRTSDQIRIYKNGKKDYAGTKAAAARYIDDNTLFTGVYIYALSIKSKTIVQIELTASGRRSFTKFVEKEYNQNPSACDFTIAGFRKHTEDEKKKGVVEFVPNFIPYKGKEKDIELAEKLCEEKIDTFFDLTESNKNENGVEGVPVVSRDDLPI